jgi:hypothetical protein
LTVARAKHLLKPLSAEAASAILERMSPVTHLLAGWMVASMPTVSAKRDRALVTLASVVPDIDGLGIIPELLTRNRSKLSPSLMHRNAGSDNEYEGPHPP